VKKIDALHRKEGRGWTERKAFKAKGLDIYRSADMARSVMTTMMAKIDELKEQMTDHVYKELCDELMRLHASTPPDPEPMDDGVDAPATPERVAVTDDELLQHGFTRDDISRIEEQSRQYARAMLADEHDTDSDIDI
jgi:hypothetical protein